MESRAGEIAGPAFFLTISRDDVIISTDDIETRYQEVRKMGRKTLELLTESMFYVLMSLLREDRCGTEMADWVQGRTGGRVRLGPGTLYTILAKFQEENLIRETAVDGRRRTYTLTEEGRRRYLEEVARLRACLSDAEEEGQ